MIGTTSAAELGKKAYLDGVDLFNSPSYLNAQEQEAWRLAYEDEMHKETLEYMSAVDEDEDFEPRDEFEFVNDFNPEDI